MNQIHVSAIDQLINEKDSLRFSHRGIPTTRFLIERKKKAVFSSINADGKLISGIPSGERKKRSDSARTFPVFSPLFFCLLMERGREEKKFLWCRPLDSFWS